MEKYDKEKLQAKIAGKVLKAIEIAVNGENWDEAKKLIKLFNNIDRGWQFKYIVLNVI